MSVFDVGDLARIGNHVASGVGAFANLAGAATDPTAVVLIIEKPSGADLIYGWPVADDDGLLTRESAGRFYADVAIDQAGRWWYEIAGTGAVTASATACLDVKRQMVAP